MECLGYGEGPTGVVLEVMQPGYRTADVVVRPAGVLIADPRAQFSSTAGRGSLGGQES
jgi:hypothetical protein